LSAGVLTRTTPFARMPSRAVATKCQNPLNDSRDRATAIGSRALRYLILHPIDHIRFKMLQRFRDGATSAPTVDAGYA